MATSDVIAPLRTCIGCRRRRPQPEMVRCVLGTSGALVSRTAPGRGAWLCSPECFGLAERRKGFERAWRAPVPADEMRRLEPQVGIALGTAMMEESRRTKG